MRSLLITLLGTLISFLAPAQSTIDGEKVLSQLSGLYNKNDYKEIYQMLSPEFRTNATEDQIVGFFQTNMKQPYGNIVSWKLTDNKGVLKYSIQLDKGNIDLTMVLNGKNEITAMRWLPSKGNTEVKKRDVSAIRSNNPKQTKLELLVDSLALAHLSNTANSGLAIGIINGDKTELFYYGTNNKTADKLPDANTLYEIGSLTKTFTGIILAHAVNEGKISPDDDIRKYLPGPYPNLQYKGEPIRIKNLSNHTSGLPRIPEDLDKQPNYDANDPYKNYSEEMIYEYLKTIKLDTLPGTKNEYSNLAVGLLGLILEKVYKQPLESLVKSFVAEPAKMNSTKLSLSDADNARLAIGYNQAGSETPYWSLGAVKAAGGLKSDLPDMMKYLGANVNEINPDFRLAHQQTYKDARIAVGLNWMISTTKDKQTLVWHNGATFGFTSFCGYIKEKQVGIVVLNNSGMIVDNIAIAILKEMKDNK